MTLTLETADLEYRRSSLLGKIERLLDTADSQKRGITDAEQVEIDGHHAELNAIAHRLGKGEQRSGWQGAGPIPVPDFSGLATTTARGGVYTPESRDSYFRDLFQSGRGDSGAAERLDRHAREFREHAANSGAKELRAIDTTSTSSFAPPLYLLNDYVAALRPGRATADALTNLPLPAGTDQLNIPKLATGTTAAIQGGQNTAISNTDITTSTISAPVYTIAGGQTVSQQLLDQSPISGSIDKVILEDLLAAYQQQAGALVLNGTGTGQPQGLFTAAANVVTYTDATPGFSGPTKLYAKIGQAVQTVQTARYAGPTAIVMHPRRWAWIAVQVDTQNRPVVVPGDQGPTNANGVYSTGAAQGIVGRMFGLPVIIDPAIATNLGTGSNQDQILIGKLDDSWLYEGSINAEAFSATYANSLGVYCRLFRYIALGHRTAQSLVAIGGTGLIAPSF